MLLALTALGLVLAYAATAGKNTLVGRHTEHLLSTIEGPLGKIKKPLAQPIAKVQKLAQGLGKAGHDDPEHWALRDACMDAMFKEKAGFHFSESRWGGAPVPYQFRGLELIGPEKLPPNAGDIQRGIDLRIGYEFQIAAYRRYNSQTQQWEPWQFEDPPNLSSMSFARQDGKWKIADAPNKSYAVR